MTIDDAIEWCQICCFTSFNAFCVRVCVLWLLFDSCCYWCPICFVLHVSFSKTARTRSLPPNGREKMVHAFVIHFCCCWFDHTDRRTQTVIVEAFIARFTLVQTRYIEYMRAFAFNLCRTRESKKAAIVWCRFTCTTTATTQCVFMVACMEPLKSVCFGSVTNYYIKSTHTKFPCETDERPKLQLT